MARKFSVGDCITSPLGLLDEYYVVGISDDRYELYSTRHYSYEVFHSLDFSYENTFEIVSSILREEEC